MLSSTARTPDASLTVPRSSRGARRAATVVPVRRPARVTLGASVSAGASETGPEVTGGGTPAGGWTGWSGAVVGVAGAAATERLAAAAGPGPSFVALIVSVPACTSLSV